MYGLRFRSTLVVVLLLAAVSCSRPSPPRPPAGPAAQPREQERQVSTGPGIASADLYVLRSVGDVQLSPDGARIAFTVQNNDRAGEPYTEIWTADVSGQPAKLPGVAQGSSPRWSPDGRRLAFIGRTPGGKAALIVADTEGTRVVTELAGTNHPLPAVGDRLAWSPNGDRIAFVSAVDGPEPAMNDADPIVITRYWYRPSISVGARFNDNRRLHLFVVDLATTKIRQLTDGPYYEHSIDWSPQGDRIAFLSNHEPDPDFFFNYDIFLLDVASGAVRRLTETRSNEYRPVWSPDGRMIAYSGTKRPVTSSETNMEDTHAWVLDVATGARREVGASIDNRQGAPQWAADGRSLFFTVQSRGLVGLCRMPIVGAGEEYVVPAAAERGTVVSFSPGKGNVVAFAMSTPARPADLFLKRAGGTTMVTLLNEDVLGRKEVAPVEALAFKSFDGREVEAFLTMPAHLGPGEKDPMIVMIHGGPHGQQGPAFNHRAQVYAARGWAALMVNYRGSTGYGQKFSDAIARDQDGAEAKDVLAAVGAAIASHPWIDPNRLGVEGGSYGGQLSNWLVTQTDRFKAAVPAASISNLVSHNYMSVYHDYLEQEYGGRPHTGGIVDMLWERSAIRLANRVKTPVMFIHGDNDNLVNVAEIEQFYIALKDVGVETVMVRYPREGHSMRETRHIVDVIDRSIAWYERHFRGDPSRRGAK